MGKETKIIPSWQNAWMRFSFHHSLRTHKLSVFSISLLKCGEEPRNYRPAGHTSIVRWTGDNQLFHLSTRLLGTMRMDYTVFLSVFYPSCIIADSFIFPPWSLILHCIINSLLAFSSHEVLYSLSIFSLTFFSHTFKSSLLILLTFV